MLVCSSLEFYIIHEQMQNIDRSHFQWQRCLHMRTLDAIHEYVRLI